MLKLTIEQHRGITFWGLALIAIGLPLSVFAISVGQIVLAANWLLEGNLKAKIVKIFTDPLSLILISLYGLLLLGMIHTQDVNQGLKELRIKLPLFILPLLLFTSNLPKKRMLQNVFFVFVAATVLGSILGCIQRYWFEEPNLMNKRGLSIFVSHIRFGLMVVFSFFLLGYYLVVKRKLWSKTGKILTIIAMLWLFYFLILLESPSSFLAFMVLSGFTLLRTLFTAKNKYIKVVAIIVFAVGATSITAYVVSIYNNHILDLPVNYETIDTHTVNGRKYKHQKNGDARENGNRVWDFISRKELKNEWPSKSQIALNDSDKSGQILFYTLTRYMASKGLRKDSVGIHALTEEDIYNIENGFTNYKYVATWSIGRRIDQLICELEDYQSGGNPNESSLIQRITYFKIGLAVIKENWIWGVGTGDLYRAFKTYYNNHDLGLVEERQGIAHNQYLSIALATGIFGFLWFVFAFLYPLARYWKDYLYVSFILMIALSFLSDNTFDSQAGVTLFAFFNTLLMIRKEYNED
ncbi:O-antigen ligase family protein [Bacteroidota bacterium]